MMQRCTFYLTYLFLLSLSLPTQANTCGLTHPTAHPAQYQRLILLSNFATIQNIQEIPIRLQHIAQIFAHTGDRRGLFAAIYAPVTKQAIPYLSTLSPSTRHSLTKIMWFFAESYFKALHKHLTAQPIPAYWHLYYQSALTCQTSHLRVISYGFLAHLSFDLKNALLKAGATDGLFPDYLLLGNALARTKPAIIYNVTRLYHINTQPLLEGFWIGDTFNRSTQQPHLTTILTFNALRTEAWMSSRAQHYTLGFFDQMIEQSHMMLWKMRVQMLKRLIVF